MREGLFNKVPLRVFFDENNRKLRVEISNYTDNKLMNINVEDEVTRIMNKHGLDVPVLVKQETTSSIQKVPNQNIEVVTYSIPYTGDHFVFHIAMRGSDIINRFWVFSDGGRIKVQFRSDYGRAITGNDEAIEAIKNQFNALFDLIEKTLQEVKVHFDEYNAKVLPEIREELNNRVTAVKAKNDTLNKLKNF